MTLNNADNQPKSLMDIIDEAYGIVDRMIDDIRATGDHVEHMPFKDTYDDLKDLRSLLGLAESFRDYEEEDK